MNNLARHFDRAAEAYDSAASLQAQVAEHLVQKAIKQTAIPPASTLDIGCGTGFVAEAAAKQWPKARITAIDGAPAMLKHAQRKIPHLRVITGNVADQQFPPSFDLILSSMALHWLHEPRTALEKWCKWLTPTGHMYVATLVEGSFQEWRDLCNAAGLADGLWPMPPANFADDLVTEHQALSVVYPSAKDFLHRLKTIGAAMPRPGHKPFDAAQMRQLLMQAPMPFTVTYRVLYINAPSPDSI